jgi:hypothetical protein
MEQDLNLTPRTKRKYVPKSLSPEQKRLQIRSIIKGVKRPTIKDRPQRRSKWTILAHNYFGYAPSLDDLATELGVPTKALEEIKKKGEGAYFTSGSRPNVSPEAWGIARVYAVAFGSPGARRVDADIITKYKIPILTDMDGSGKMTETADLTPPTNLRHPDPPSITELLKGKKLPENYSTEVAHIINRVSLGKKEVLVMGSAHLRSQQFASDYDLWENASAPNVGIFAKRFQEVIRNLEKDPRIFIGDIKLGNKVEWRVIHENAYFDNDKLIGYNPTEARENITKLLKDKVISKKEYDDGMKLILDKPDLLQLRNALKELRYNILRWKPQDVLNGYLTLRNGEKYPLDKALSDPALFKMDFFALLNDGIFQEFSIIYDLRIRGKRLNVFPVNTEHAIKSEMAYYSHTKNYWKFLKRFFSLTSYQYRLKRGKEENLTHIIQVLSHILNSDLGIISNVKSEIEGLVYLLENQHRLPMDRVKDQIDGFIGRLGNVYTANTYLKNEPKILDAIRMVLDMDSKDTKSICFALTTIYDKLDDILNIETKKKMDEVGLRVVAR